MIRTVGAELRKLARHPVALIVVFVLFAFIWAESRTAFHFARLQTPVAVAATASRNAAADPTCTSEATLSPHCEQQLIESRLNSHFASNAIDLGRTANALTTWPGLLRFVSHQLATGLGLIMLGALVSVHVAGEWRSRTAANSILAARGLPRLWTAKVFSLWLFMVGVALLGTSLLYVIRPTFATTIGVPAPATQQGDVSSWHLQGLSPDPTWSSWTGALSALAVAASGWLLLSFAGTAIASWVRKPVATLAVAVAALSAAITVGRWMHRPAWTPLPAVTQLLHLGQTPYGVHDTTLWYVPGGASDIYTTRVAQAVDARSVAGWTAALILVAALALVGARRRRVLG